MTISSPLEAIRTNIAATPMPMPFMTLVDTASMDLELRVAEVLPRLRDLPNDLPLVVRREQDWAHTICTWVPSVLWGVAFANLVQGMRIEVAASTPRASQSITSWPMKPWTCVST